MGTFPENFWIFSKFFDFLKKNVSLKKTFAKTFFFKADVRKDAAAHVEISKQLIHIKSIIEHFLLLLHQHRGVAAEQPGSPVQDGVLHATGGPHHHQQQVR